jgi:peroxiredoxin
MMQEANEKLAETKMNENILGVWEKFPNVLLKDIDSKEVRIQDYFKKWPVILSYYRWGWCPYCNLELRELSKNIWKFEKYNAQLIAISPETPENWTQTIEKNQLTYPVLSDEWNILSEALRLKFKLPQNIVDLYNSFGLDIQKFNGDTKFELPLPWTYIIGTDGIIIFADAQTDYTKRTEISDLLEALK